MTGPILACRACGVKLTRRNAEPGCATCFDCERRAYMERKATVFLAQEERRFLIEVAPDPLTIPPDPLALFFGEGL